MPNTTYGTPYAQSSDLVSNWPGVSLNVADRLDDVSFKGNGLNDQTGTTYTLVLTDAGKTVTLNNASAVTVTLPTNASVAYEIGTVIEFTNKGAGVVTISPAGGVTLNNSSTLAQYASCYIQKLETNTWVMVSAAGSGLTLISASTFAAVSSVSLNNCFTAIYDNYRVELRSVGSVDSSVIIRWRASGSDNSTASYYQQGLYANTNVAYGDAVAATTSVGPNVTTVKRRFFAFDVSYPQLADRTIASGIETESNDLGPGLFVFGSVFQNTNQFDGLSVIASTGTITGTIRVYGYRNS